MPEKPILYVYEQSPSVRSVILTAKAIGLGLHFKYIDIMAGDHKMEKYAKLNPQRQAPTLVDNKVIISDSHAIASYLVRKYAKNDALYSNSLYKRALIDQQLHFDSRVLQPPIIIISNGVLNLNWKHVPKEYIDMIIGGYDSMEITLYKNVYVVGDSLTIADFSCIASITTLQSIVEINPEKYPKIIQWIGRLSNLPYYEEANGRGAREYKQLYQAKLRENK